MAETLFHDMEGNPYHEIAQKWIDKAYIEGYEDGTFRPSNPITRAEFMALVNRALDLKEIENASFTDVLINDWFYEEVLKAVKKGYMKGSENRMFPANNISRQEFAVVVSRLGSLDENVDETVLSTLTDENQIPDWSKGAVCATLKAKFFEGFVIDEFNPTEVVSRMEVVVVLDRLIDSLLVTIQEEQIPQAPIVTKKHSGSGGSTRRSTQVSDVTVTSANIVTVISSTDGFIKENFGFEPSVSIESVVYINGIYTLTLTNPD